jgi:hypothetical protein
MLVALAPRPREHGIGGFYVTQIFTKNVVTARRAPNSPADVGSCIKSFRLPKQAQDSRVSFQPQYQAFVRSAVGSGTAL